ncbi:hypothetical protein KC332_g13156 [Hortaea werneckii]|uniref:Zn(2)-C6 fungal-type domain-containing protein n=1 Tax=Hortaea werneckii EXF-2000 TaxID=1157616 RepID=A0A1Z5TS31_HORWE|nr:hypothetical protein KC358_g13144 [Hortaea werneckii]OTA38741.1 hypothetical protein BTJ68_01116 [Hortaea werneckii EXF-2000]KAI6809588.1 hypothetical protein KC350_g12874 [Hortaea werneckii]KAI6910449.1 hypothetical protein KC348_g13201 [Hortaea werneckii]KAI6926214.1 hypothetical protein KC341_g12910 [Hortaea werneckii]
MERDTSDALLAHIGGESFSPTDSRPRKRQKVTRACDRCKSRKRRCDGMIPCSVCSDIGATCSFDASYTRGKLVGPRQPSGKNSPVAPASAPVDQSTQINDTDAANEHAPGEGAQAATASSAYSFLKRAWERFGRETGEVGSLSETDHSDPTQMVPVLNYGDKRVVPPPASSLESLVRKPNGHALLSTYFDFAMPTYRFLHRQTVEQWYKEVCEDTNRLSPARKAIILLVLATATFFEESHKSDGEISLTGSEAHYQAARHELNQETGRPRLESVQSRFAACLYLLHTSRPNEAWYLFGTTIQIALILGLHQRRSVENVQPGGDIIIQECRKRTFWAMSTLDTYLSIILGRPVLIHDADCDQQLPAELDDEELSKPDIISRSSSSRDRIIAASILHARIAHIVRRAAQEQGKVARKQDDRKTEAATKAGNEVAAWHASLPVILSGAVHPTSLVPVYRRQVAVLGLAHKHAIMLINRPMLLMESVRSMLSVKSHVESCLSAADGALDVLMAHTPSEGYAPLASLWFTSYVAFNAVSIIYVWAIQRARGRLQSMQVHVSDDSLLDKAQSMQSHLSSSSYAPGLRYNAVLRELREELQRLQDRKPPSQPNAATPLQSSNVLEQDFNMGFQGLELPLDPDFWLQMDSFPFADLDLAESTLIA